jgi:hypothetical protein
MRNPLDNMQHNLETSLSILGIDTLNMRKDFTNTVYTFPTPEYKNSCQANPTTISFTVFVLSR